MLDSLLLPLVLIAIAVVTLLYLRSGSDPSKSMPPESSFSWRPAIIDFYSDPISYSEKATKKYGGVWSFRYAPHRRWIMITDKDLFKAHFQATDEVISLPKAVDTLMPHVFGSGSFSQSAEWTAGYKRVVNNGFWRPTQLDNYESIIQQQVDYLLEDWTSRYAATGEYFDLFKESGRLTALINLRIVLGAESAESLREEWGTIFPRFDRLIAEWSVTLAPWLPWGKPAEFRVARKRILGLIAEAYDLTLERVQDELGDKLKVTDSYMEMLVRNFEGKFPRDLIHGHILAIAIAAHLNTANSLAWSLAHAAAEPRIAAKLRKESLDMAASVPSTTTKASATPVGEENVNGANATVSTACYAHCVLREAVRLYPVLGTIRMAPAKVQIPGSNFWANEGDMISVNAIGVHRDPKYFPDEPQSFIPERFENPETVRVWSSAMAFVGFGNGVHRCLGEKYVMIIAKRLLHSVFARFDVQLKNAKLPAPRFTATGDPGACEPVLIRVKALN